MRLTKQEIIIAGIVSLIGVFLPGYAILLILVPVILVALFTVIYSYVQYRQETRV